MVCETIFCSCFPTACFIKIWKSFVYHLCSIRDLHLLLSHEIFNLFMTIWIIYSILPIIFPVRIPTQTMVEMGKSWLSQVINHSKYSEIFIQSSRKSKMTWLTILWPMAQCRWNNILHNTPFSSLYHKGFAMEYVRDCLRICIIPDFMFLKNINHRKRS